jgi:hypothetical protein
MLASVLHTVHRLQAQSERQMLFKRWQAILQDRFLQVRQTTPRLVFLLFSLQNPKQTKQQTILN